MPTEKRTPAAILTSSELYECLEDLEVFSSAIGRYLTEPGDKALMAAAYLRYASTRLYAHLSATSTSPTARARAESYLDRI